MATDLIRYDLLVHEALRGVVRRVLEDTMREGLPGEHHYYVTFRTKSPGVRLSDRMRERYPEEMTIILQHQFWDLTVNDHAFEVGLSFSGVPERLVVPFDSLTGFFDPSVQFGLKFEVQEPTTEIGANDTGTPPPEAADEPAKVAKLPAGRAAPSAREAKPALRGAASEPTEVAPAAQSRPTGKPDSGQTVDAAAKPASETGPKVISIDAFRKKP